MEEAGEEFPHHCTCQKCPGTIYVRFRWAVPSHTATQAHSKISSWRPITHQTNGKKSKLQLIKLKLVWFHGKERPRGQNVYLYQQFDNT